MFQIRSLLLALYLFFSGIGCFSQEVPVKQQDRNTFTFSTENIRIDPGFRIEGASYHLTSDLYEFHDHGTARMEKQPIRCVTGNFVS